MTDAEYNRVETEARIIRLEEVCPSRQTEVYAQLINTLKNIIFISCANSEKCIIDPGCVIIKRGVNYTVKGKSFDGSPYSVTFSKKKITVESSQLVSRSVTKDVFIIEYETDEFFSESVIINVITPVIEEFRKRDNFEFLEMFESRFSKMKSLQSADHKLL